MPITNCMLSNTPRREIGWWSHTPSPNYSGLCESNLSRGNSLQMWDSQRIFTECLFFTYFVVESWNSVDFFQQFWRIADFSGFNFGKWLHFYSEALKFNTLSFQLQVPRRWKHFPFFILSILISVEHNSYNKWLFAFQNSCIGYSSVTEPRLLKKFCIAW